MIEISIGSSTKLLIGRAILQKSRFAEFIQKRKVVVIADEAIRELHGVELAQKIGGDLIAIPSGEKGKTIQTAEKVIEQLFKLGCGRDTLLVALGGGVTTDLVGFTASVYMRSIPLILIPTTLLGMVDAAIGGKTGVDTPYGKNLIGTIYPPKAIFADLDLLETLPEKEWLNGLAEILKMGLIHRADLWEMGTKDLKSQERLLKAIRGKIEIVEQDPTEQGIRRILNFGHTIAHALEKAAEYEMAHGEAVAIGSIGEAHLSFSLGYLSAQEFGEIESVYAQFRLKLPKRYVRSKLISAMALDKKREKGEIRFVLIDRIGHAIPFGGAYCRTVTEKELEPTLDWIEKWISRR